MTERSTPRWGAGLWWRKALKVAWDGVRTGFGLFGRASKTEPVVETAAEETISLVVEEVLLERSETEQEVEPPLKEVSTEQEADSEAVKDKAAEVRAEDAPLRVEAIAELASELEEPELIETENETEVAAPVEVAAIEMEKTEAPIEGGAELGVAEEKIVKEPEAETPAAAMEDAAEAAVVDTMESEAARVADTDLDRETEVAEALEETEVVTKEDAQERMDAEPEQDAAIEADAEAGAAAAEAVAEEPVLEAEVLNLADSDLADPDVEDGETGVPRGLAEEVEQPAEPATVVPENAESTDTATGEEDVQAQETVSSETVSAGTADAEEAGVAPEDATSAAAEVGTDETVPLPADAAVTTAEMAPPKKLIKLEAKGEDASPFSILVEAVYDGPLDLLLDLIRKQDIDIYDIPIARITAQFLAYVNQLKAGDVDVAGEFIYTASLLIHIKSKMLLPREPSGPEDAAEDPRRELVERLLEHERFKNAAQMLQQKQMLEAATWTNPGFREFQDDAAAEPEIAADTVDLVRIFREILERARTRPVLDVQEDSVTVGQMVQFLARRLTMEDKPIALRRLLSHTHSERALIAMFLALLELVRMQAILLRQDLAFSEIFIKKNTGFDAVMNSGLANAQDDWR